MESKWNYAPLIVLIFAYFALRLSIKWRRGIQEKTTAIRSRRIFCPE
jgi:hypothetical protein